MAFELKKLSPKGVEAALEKAEHYRLLNEPYEAESMCRDVLAVDPDNQQARVILVLAITDQFFRDTPPPPNEARRLAGELDDAYKRDYYTGIICERQAKAHLARRASPAAGYIAYDWFRQAMEWFEKAEANRPEDDDSALLRWNTCARLLNKHAHLRPAPQETPMMLE